GACGGAAPGGHLDIVTGASRNGCQWDKRTCDLAAQGGHLHVLKWAIKHGCVWDSNTFVGAAWGANLELFCAGHARTAARGIHALVRLRPDEGTSWFCSAARKRLSLGCPNHHEGSRAWAPSSLDLDPRQPWRMGLAHSANC
ncbi:unnamed protein product, partial [Ectocarpus sp. 12 AP-2014]